MTYVVTRICLDCKYTDCVDVCPTAAFHEGPDHLFINPDSCIDCDACVSECPVNAIYSDQNLPAQYSEDKIMNAIEAKKYPIIPKKITPLKGPKCVNSNAR